MTSKLYFALPLLAPILLIAEDRQPSSARSSVQAVDATARYGQLPLSFEANEGQTASAVRFLSRGEGYSLFLTHSEAVFSLRRDLPSRLSDPAEVSAKQLQQTSITAAETDVVRMQLADANPAVHLSGIDKLTESVNYFVGDDPKQWRTRVPAYSRVKYKSIYPGVDLVYYGNGQQLEYDFSLAPHSDPNSIKLRFIGLDTLRLNERGDLVMKTKHGEMALQKPVVYQERSGRRCLVSGRFTLLAKRTVGFALGEYDHSRPLVIDPKLIFSSTFGGSVPGAAGAEGTAIAVDSRGHSFVTGYASPDFPVTEGAFQTTTRGIFITKLNREGTALVYSTYLGGSGLPTHGGDYAVGIAVDASGNAYVTGYTYSTDFPVTPDAFQKINHDSVINQTHSAFVTKLNADGTDLLYSTYLGGSGYLNIFGGEAYGDAATGIAIDGSGHAYIVGNTSSVDFPSTPGAFESSSPWGGYPGVPFVTKLNEHGSGLLYSSFFGETSLSTVASGIAVDRHGLAYIVGSSYGFMPVTAGALQPTNNGLVNGAPNAFVAKFNQAGSGLVYSSYLGGSGLPCGSGCFDSVNFYGDFASGIALDHEGNAYVSGFAYSADFPVSSGAFQKINKGVDYSYTNGFVTKVNAEGNALLYSTYLGGDGGDKTAGIAVDDKGSAYVIGYTDSADFPLTIDAMKKVFLRSSGSSFISTLNREGSALKYSSLFGGSSYQQYDPDKLTSIALDEEANVYLTGAAVSPDFPRTGGAFHKDFQFSGVFISKLDLRRCKTRRPEGPSDQGESEDDGLEVEGWAYPVERGAPVRAEFVPCRR